MTQMTCKCGTVYKAREADIKRGWGKSCSKRCAAKKREGKTGNYKRFKADIKSDQDYEHHFVGGYHDFDEDY